MAACLHCHAKRIKNIRRRLCAKCYRNPLIRSKYPTLCKGHDGDGNPVPLMMALFPTKALPGTSAKVEVMRLRAESRQHIWHPHDA